MLCPTTCVGFGYGRPSTIASRLFSAPQDHPVIPHQCEVTITPHPRVNNHVINAIARIYLSERLRA